MSWLEFLQSTDNVGRAVALALLLMSVASWVLIVWRSVLLRRARQALNAAVPAFWQGSSWADGLERAAVFDRIDLLGPLLRAVDQGQSVAQPGRFHESHHWTRQLRHGLRQSVYRLQFGQTMLATIGSTSPFVGLLGTVWGIYHAMASLSAGGVQMDRIAGPVGEALVMTAAGLAVALPAVMAYNLMGRWAHVLEEELEAFAHDLLQTLSHSAPSTATSSPG